MSNRNPPLYAYVLFGAAVVIAIVANGSYPSFGAAILSAVQWSIIVALAAAVISVYLIPWRVAKRREHPNAPAILVLNLLLGWTLIGWAIALTWAMTAHNQQARS